MSISTLGTLFQFIGGLGMFLYGMESMADGLQKFAGNRLQRVLEILTSNRLLGVLVGAGVTAIIQSSSASVGILQMLAINGYGRWFRKCRNYQSFAGDRHHHGCQYWYDCDELDCVDE